MCGIALNNIKYRGNVTGTITDVCYFTNRNETFKNPPNFNMLLTLDYLLHEQRDGKLTSTNNHL